MLRLTNLPPALEWLLLSLAPGLIGFGLVGPLLVGQLINSKLLIVLTVLAAASIVFYVNDQSIRLSAAEDDEDRP